MIVCKREMLPNKVANLAVFVGFVVLRVEHLRRHIVAGADKTFHLHQSALSTAALSSSSRPDTNGTIKASASLSDLQDAAGGGGGTSPNSTATGRLGQSEMAARRLNFLLSRLQLLLGLSAKESCKVSEQVGR